MVRMVSSLLLVLLPVLYAYRESDSMLSALTRDSKGPESEGDDTDANAMDENKEKEESVEGPKETTKSGERRQAIQTTRAS
ncbi:unnamed protein product [Durusdinium trenchii]|uniref:Secreted protein n=1 Tax=Durusdinium trenchii TaxID=1381693 RepID=A0ABP0PWW4_9DINO